MDSILQHLNLSQPIQDALFERKGILGAILEMAESLESGAIATCQECLHQLPLLDAGQLNACHAEALAWANMIGCEVHE
jgi:c-di-GMP-related signal transduction protein